MRKNVFGLLIFAAVLVCFSAVLEATVLRVVVVETEDPQAYMNELKRGQELLNKAGSTIKIRGWIARYAGDQTGSVVVSAEYPDMTALAEDEKRFQTDTELAAWLKGLDKLRKIVSDSLYTELK